MADLNVIFTINLESKSFGLKISMWVAKISFKGKMFLDQNFNDNLWKLICRKFTINKL